MDSEPLHDDEWLAGLVEGEGHVGFTASNTRGPLPQVAVKMTDLEVVTWVAELIGCKSVNGPYNQSNPRHKPLFVAKRIGNPATDVLRRIWPWMGARKSALIANVLQGESVVANNRGIGWLAGLLEGEGCFYRQHRSNGGGTNYVALRMCDRDIVEAAAQLMPSKRAKVSLVPHGEGTSRPDHWTPCWQYRPGGKTADEISEAVLPWMSAARRNKILNNLGVRNVQA